jgi:FtsZ-binding cell division protein ZapB
MYLCMMRIYTRHTADEIRLAHSDQTSQRYVGVLFRFGEISANMTTVRSDATIRAAGDAILIEHEYPTIDKYKPAGRISSYYTKDGALLIEFDILEPEVVNLITSGEKPYLSVSWFSDNYEVKIGPSGAYVEFRDIVIYEVSLVSNPAFSTCISTDESGLSCLTSLNNETITNSQGSCGCGGKKKCACVSLSDMVAKHQEVTREEFDALKEKVQQALDAIAALADEVKALKEAVTTTPDELVAELEQAKHKLDKLELELAGQATNVEGLLRAAERLLEITEKTYKNLPNLIRK